MKDSKSGRLRAGFIKKDNSNRKSSGNNKDKGKSKSKSIQQDQNKKARKKDSSSSTLVSGDDIRKEYTEASTNEKDSSELNKLLKESMTEEDEKRKRDEEDLQALALALRKLAEENKIKLKQ